MSKFMTTGDLAGALSVSERWLRKSAAPRRKLGHRTVRWDRGEVEAWMAGLCRDCGRHVGADALSRDGRCVECRNG